MPQIIPIKDLKDTSTISSMCNNTAEPIFITKNGYGDMVIMSIKAYEEKLAIAEIYDKLLEAEDCISNGKTSDARLHLKNLREKYNV